VPATAVGAELAMTSFRPHGDGPFPRLVLSHGNAPPVEANRTRGRYHPLEPVRRASELLSLVSE
jgi:hypothetical protein